MGNGSKMKLWRILRYRTIAKYRLLVSKYKFKTNNKHNSLRLETIVPDGVIECGNYSYGPIYLYANSNRYRLQIGSFCSIADNTSFLLDVIRVGVI